MLYLNHHNTKKHKELPRMASITQDMRYRLSLIKYAAKFGVTKAAVKFKTNRQYIYRWKRRYDGSWDSLRDRSRRPLHHPNQHTDSEIKLIRDMRRRNLMTVSSSSGLSSASVAIPVLFQAFTVSLKNRASWPYTRRIQSIFRSPMKKWTFPDSAFRWM